jgi:hypothetical protein
MPLLLRLLGFKSLLLVKLLQVADLGIVIASTEAMIVLNIQDCIITQALSVLWVLERQALHQQLGMLLASDWNPLGKRR